VFEAQASGFLRLLVGFRGAPLKPDRLRGADRYVAFDHQTSEFGPVDQHDPVGPVG
jgi:hypothetical protein